jgi:hypothetical protein
MRTGNRVRRNATGIVIDIRRDDARTHYSEEEENSGAIALKSLSDHHGSSTSRMQDASHTLSKQARQKTRDYEYPRQKDKHDNRRPGKQVEQAAIHIVTHNPPIVDQFQHRHQDDRQEDAVQRLALQHCVD